MSPSIPHKLNLRAGEWVEVRSKAEILNTLNSDGQLECMPFMPEMFQYCGQRMRVFKRAHKTCDPVNGPGGRRMRNAVHLEKSHCDGTAHGGCEARCLIFWKEAWLKRVSKSEEIKRPAQRADSRSRCTENDVTSGVTVAEAASEEGPTYVCQATQVARATEPLAWWDIRQYMEDYTSGNTRMFQMFSSLVFTIYHTIASAGLGLGTPMRWLYDQFQRARGGVPYPWREGKVPTGVRTPSMSLKIQEGERVRIKNYHEILETLDENWKNRGLYFDAEMVPFCGGTYEVLKRVRRIIHEGTGKMLILKNEALILDGVMCQARYAKCRKFCPRGYYQYCREIWLERVSSEERSDRNAQS